MPKNQLKQAVDILRAGGLVAFPTETVYGLGADAMNDAALHKIFKAKERPYHNPLIVHVAHIEEIYQFAAEVPPIALRLAAAFWPGGLTLVLKKHPQISTLLTGGQNTIAIRIPNHPIALDLLKAFGGGIAAPSANKYTHISPTTAAAVKEELDGRIDLILDGGECAVGLESTIIDITTQPPTILRPGMISAAEISAVIGTEIGSASQTIVRVPGMHHLHYAPQTTASLYPPNELDEILKNVDYPAACMLINKFSISAKIKCISMPADPAHYAHDLYRVLRDLDHGGFKKIFIEAVPSEPEWDAIRDRLNKACYKREST